MLGADKTITIYHQGYDKANDEDTYTSVVIKGVSIYDKPVVSASSTGLVSNDSVIIRIPQSAYPAQPLPASVGDLIVAEHTADEIGKDGVAWADIEKLYNNVYTVTACRDRRNRALPHIIIEAK